MAVLGRVCVLGTRRRIGFQAMNQVLRVDMHARRRNAETHVPPHLSSASSATISAGSEGRHSTPTRSWGRTPWVCWRAAARASLCASSQA